MSEFSLIHAHFKNATHRHAQTALGIGDDCAISHIPADTQLVSCMDTLVMGRHFPMDTSAHAIAYKSVAVNLSDLAAMGATPYAILLGLSLPVHLANDTWLSEFARGLSDICSLYGVELIGGDTTGSDVLTISITALGWIAQGGAITRDGAKLGDVICVSGQIGTASYALSHLLKHQDTPLRSALDYPVPQVALGQALVGYASSMIDVSDGLGQDLGHILASSGVGAVLNLDGIPCDDTLNALPDTDKYQHILNGGDDYQLCLTLPKDAFYRFNERHPNTIFAIGEIVARQGVRLLNRGKLVNIAIKGWEHF